MIIETRKQIEIIENYMKNINIKLNTLEGLKYYLDKLFKNDINIHINSVVNYLADELNIDHILNVKYLVKIEVKSIIYDFLNKSKNPDELDYTELYRKISQFKLNLVTYGINYTSKYRSNTLSQCVHYNLEKQCFECYIHSLEYINHFDFKLFISIFRIIHMLEDTNTKKFTISLNYFLQSDILKLFYYLTDELYFNCLSNHNIIKPYLSYGVLDQEIEQNNQEYTDDQESEVTVLEESEPNDDEYINDQSDSSEESENMLDFDEIERDLNRINNEINEMRDSLFH